MAAVNKCWILCVFALCSASASQPLRSAPNAAEPLVFTELCVMKEDAGPCKALLEQFFFDVDTGRCRPFVYGGCGGNANNFLTVEACEETCVVSADKSPCHLGEAPGPCRGLVTRYFFNRVTRQCQQFYYGGCFGNANNFRSMAECQSKCQKPAKTTKEPVTEVRPKLTNSSETQPKPILEEVVVLLQATPNISVQQNGFNAPSFCMLTPVEGPCQANLRHFAFSPRTQRCHMFRYGGCGGNQNNFKNRRQCMKICMNAQHHKPRFIRIRKKNVNTLLREA